MGYPQYDGISCEHCGLVSPAKLRSCEHRPGGICPYVPQEEAPRPARLPGLLMIAMALAFLFGFGVLPFAIYPKGAADAYGLVVGTLVLTFAFTIANIFVLFGLAFAGLRKSLFYNKAQLRYVETWTILGLPLAHRLVTLGETIPVQVGCPPLPLSLAGFLMERSRSVLPRSDAESPPETRSTTLTKLNEINTRLDHSLAHALFGAITHLDARSCVVFRHARQEVFSRWYTTPAADTYYIQAAGGRSDDLGLLEADLLNKITTWRSREWKVEDAIAPTFTELIKTFQDNDGDFSGYQIRKMLLTDGESRKVFRKTSEGLLGKLMPKIEPAPEAADKVKEAQRVIEDAARQLLDAHRNLGNDLFLALRRTVFKRPDKTADPVQEQNAALRKRLLFYVVGVSFALALALCCIASL